MNNNIQIQFVKIPTSESLTEFIRTKVESLLNKYPWVIKAQVYIKKQQKHIGKECICEIELSLPGPRLFASSENRNFELAVKHSISELTHQLERTKHKNLVKQH